MEKKNTILLTVIAIATLLVAVVGATFAYFTAQVQVDPDSTGSTTTTAKTYVMPSAKMTMGADIAADSTVFPGAQFVRDLTITGECPATAESGNKCDDLKTTISVNATGLDAFGTDVTYYLFEKTTDIAADLATCVNETKIDANKYTSESKCKAAIDAYIATETATPGTAKITSNANGLKTFDLTVTAPTAASSFEKSYYLIVDYKDNGDQSSDTNNQTGKSFSVVMDYYATGTKNVTP